MSGLILSNCGCISQNKIVPQQARLSDGRWLGAARKALIMDNLRAIAFGCLFKIAHSYNYDGTDAMAKSLHAVFSVET